MRRILLVVLVTLFASNSFAIVPAKTADSDAPKKKELPKSGSLSTSGTYGHGTTSANSNWGRNEEGGSPVSGSVSRISTGQWKMVLMNESKDKYIVDVSVQQFTESGGSAKADHFTYSLKAGEKAERTVSSAFNTTRAELKLDHWKRIEAPKAKEEQKEGDTQEAQSVDKKSK